MNTLREQYVVDDKGTKTGVILSIKDYKQLLEDLHDLAVVAERRDEATSSIGDVKKRLRSSGVLQD